MTQDYVMPEYKRDAFSCPFCGVYAHQTWAYAKMWDRQILYSQSLGKVQISQCRHCNEIVLWKLKEEKTSEGGTIVTQAEILFPSTSGAPMPNPDMPEDVRHDYLEAREIVALSPRGAAALLRLSIQKLLVHLGTSDKGIYKDIGELVGLGISAQVAQALDVVRVIGNNAVHPGQIDISDDRETAEALFSLINLIVRMTISEPKQIQEMYDNLPESVKQGIDQRDKNSKQT